MGIFFKKCGLEDLETLQKLSISTYYETFAKYNTVEDMEAYLESAFHLDKLRAELQDSDVEFFFLYAEDEIVGYLKVNEAAAQTDIRDPDSLEIERVYIASKYHCQGFGKRLMGFAIRRAAEKKKKYVWLGVWENNENAKRFYAKNGFYQIGEHPFVMGADEQTDYILRKDL